jgi:hypothetical protein
MHDVRDDRRVMAAGQRVLEEIAFDDGPIRPFSVIAEPRPDSSLVGQAGPAETHERGLFSKRCILRIIVELWYLSTQFG